MSQKEENNERKKKKRNKKKDIERGVRLVDKNRLEGWRVRF